MKRLLPILSLLLLTGCAAYDTRDDATPPAQEPTPVSEDLTVISTNFSFSPSSLSVSKGKSVTVRIQNSGTHTFTIDEFDVNELLPQGVSTVTFTPTQSGTFKFYCTVPGHVQRGMMGTLLVE